GTPGRSELARTKRRDTAAQSSTSFFAPLALLTLSASLIWPCRYSSAFSSWRSLKSGWAFLTWAPRGWMISASRCDSSRSSYSFLSSFTSHPLSGLTPHSSSGPPLVLALLRFLPLGRQNDAVVIFSSPPANGSTFCTLPLP